ncbi:MAG: cobalamin-dependent protein [Sandaracinaceae bacterium]|nr:cobalamin-dependent protein [Sandaracinaceae bacterium]
MRVLIVYPRFERYLEAHPALGELPPVVGMWKYKMPPALGAQILATMPPDDVEWRIHDANLRSVDFDERWDLVAISFFTPQASSAYRIGDEFRARGVPVVMGGMHPSMIPDDVAPHCDAVCIGEAEGTWPAILADARAGALRPRYGPSRPDPREWVRPRRDLFDAERDYDWFAGLVQAMRGCPRPCPYCNIPGIYGRDVRVRAPAAVAAEIRELGGRELYLTDDVVMMTNRAMRRYADELFGAIAADGGANLFLTSSLIFNARDDFLDLLAAAGTRSLYYTFGFEPISRGLYAGDPAMTARAIDIVKRVQDRGIRFYAAFGLGFDEDEPALADRLLDYCARAGVITAEFFLATPFPNTPLYHQLAREGRLLHRDWGRYNGAHVVFRPKHFTPDALTETFLGLWRDFWIDKDVERSLSCFQSRRGAPSPAAPAD